jgi:hypothetical protein
MANQAVPPSRPSGITWLAILSALFGLQSFAGAVRLFPQWLAAAQRGHYGSMAFAWVELLSAVSGLAAGYGLWRGRRWARIPFLVAALLVVGTVGMITLFGVGEGGGGWVWMVAAGFMALVTAVAAVLIRHVWRYCARGAP